MNFNTPAYKAAATKRRNDTDREIAQSGRGHAGLEQSAGSAGSPEGLGNQAGTSLLKSGRVR